MLPRPKRLTKSHFIGLKTKIVFRGYLLDVAYLPSLETRFACVISKKKIKRAVDRNRVKRKIYSLLEKRELKSPLYCIVYPKQTALYVKSSAIQSELDTVFATL